MPMLFAVRTIAADHLVREGFACALFALLPVHG